MPFVSFLNNKKYICMNKCLYLLLCGMLLLSCSHEKKVFSDSKLVDYDDFKEVQYLKAEESGLDSMLLAPIQLQVYDTILAVMNSRADKMVHLFGLNSKKKIAEHVSVGQGPNDMLVPRFVENPASIVQLSDIMTSDVVKYDLCDFLKQEDPVCTERLSLKERAFGEIRMLGDKYVGSAHKASYLLNIYGADGEVVDSIGCCPEVEWETTDSEKINMYSFSFTTDLHDKIAVCYNWTDLIDIYDGKGNLCNRIHGPKQFVSHFKEFNDGKVISSSPVQGQTRDAFFCPINMGDEFWVLFSGKSESEDNYSILADQILVYGWDGLPRRILCLDQGVFSIAVDKKNKRIYGISDAPEFHIVEFSYNE